MKKDKLYECLLNLYRIVYSSIGVDFDSLDKEDGFFYNYEIDTSAEEKIVNDFLTTHRPRLSNLEKKCIKQNYYLGVSPVGK